ncbi:Uncharacterised protein [Mycobacteroides abscessus subsp. abscessus]|nr:Uncharacterised protein [Mycobacteroides abscessus subsp. abscessus]
MRAGLEIPDHHLLDIDELIELRMLAPQDLLDDVGDLRVGDGRQVFGELVRVELAIEVRDAAEFGQPFVDGDAGHLVRPRGHDALPAEPAVVAEQRQHLDALGQERVQRAQAGHVHAVEGQRAEQHQHTGPVGDVTDDASEKRNRQKFEQDGRVNTENALQHDTLLPKTGDRRLTGTSK